MNKNVKDFLEYIVESGAYHINTIELCDRAKILLHDAFAEDVIETFDRYINSSYYANEHREIIKEENVDKVEFVKSASYYDSSLAIYINGHWNEIDDILNILKEYIKEQEQEE